MTAEVDKASRLSSIPPFPSVAVKLLTLLTSETASISSIAACIAADPVISGQLIRRANAADQTRYCEVKDVITATIAVGIDRAREISLATAASFYVSSAIRSESLRACWNHTLACAITASELAQLFGLRPAECYTAGLFHDIGRLGLMTAYPGIYAQILARAEERPDLLPELETREFGVTHTEASLWLAREWNLPESVIEVFAHSGPRPANNLDQATVVVLACRLADTFGFAVGRSASKYDEIVSALPEWAREKLTAFMSRIRESVIAEFHVFAGFEAPAKPADPAPETHPVPLVLSAAEPVSQSPRISIASVLIAVALLLTASLLYIVR